MSMYILYPDTLHMILAYLTEPDIIRLGEVFPEHEESIDMFWKTKTHLNIDYILPKDAGLLPKVLQHCPNLKILTYTKVRMDYKFSRALRKVATYCRSLEVLDLPEMFLNTEDLESLNTLTTLKRVNFETDALDSCEYDMQLLVLFTNNPKLEEVRISGRIVWYNLEKIPRTIRKFELYARLYQQSSLLSNLMTWNLDTLLLDETILSSRDVSKICKMTTLRSIDLKYNTPKEELEPLFLNNPQLEEVHLQRCSGDYTYNYSFLRKLPKSVKKFSFFHHIKIDEFDLFEFFNPTNMEELHFEANKYTLLSELPIKSPNLQVLELDCEHCAGVNLEAIQHLHQLKNLQLNKILTKHGDAIAAAARKCLQLKTLSLCGFSDTEPYPELNMETDREMRFPQETFLAIAALPKLEELKLSYFRGAEHLSGTFFSELSKNQLLTSVKIKGCPSLTNQDVLKLIKGCYSLKNVVLMNNVKLTKMLVPHSSAELFKQVNRRIVLYMCFLAEEMPPQFLKKVRLHRFMEVALVPITKW